MDGLAPQVRKRGDRGDISLPLHGGTVAQPKQQMHLPIFLSKAMRRGTDPCMEAIDLLAIDKKEGKHSRRRTN
jgi:hypothetical protein